MVIKELEVKKPEGVLRTDAIRIVQCTMRHQSSIFFEWKSGKINGKSLMGVLSMGLKYGDKLMVIINGEDQDNALEQVTQLFENRFTI